MLLRTFGGLSIEATAADGPVPSLGPRRLALLALVAAAGPRGISREKILGILWSESDEEQARHTLSQTLYSLRRETGRAWITGSTLLRIDDSITSDIAEFHDALQRDDLARAITLYSGPFLEGFYLAAAPQFETWVEETRARLQFSALKSLETLARRAVDAGAPAQAAEWWRRLTELDPFNAGYTAGRMRALSATGDLGGALRVAREYEARVRRELDAEPDAMVATLATQLRTFHTEPAAPVAPVAPVTPAAGGSPVPAIEPALRALGVLRRSRRWLLVPALMFTAIAFAVAAWSISQRASRNDTPPFLAVVTIESRDSAALGAVLRDMLATNLARVRGMQVVSNSRLLELTRTESVGASALNDAARRAGADEVMEGEVAVTPTGLTLTLRRVALRTGLVVQGYTVRAADLYALTDSATAAVALDFELDPPPDAVASVRTRSGVSYVLYEQGLRAYYHADFAGAVRLMSAALERDSAFAMAAAYAWLANRGLNRHPDAERLLPVVQRLASRSTERERLWIQGIVAGAGAPLTESIAITREFTQRFPDDPDGQILLGQALFGAGEWANAIAAFDRAVAIDSAAGATQTVYCRVCTALYHTSDVYAWWDSAAASERTFNRLVRLRGGGHAEWSSAVEALLRLGRRADAEAAIARANQLAPSPRDYDFVLDRDLIRNGRLDELEARLIAQLRTEAPNTRGEMPWLLAFVLRNQGRLREARELAENGTVARSNLYLPGHSDPTMLAITALEAGEPRESARRFLEMAAGERANLAQRPGHRARGISWYTTLAGTALAAAGDTSAVRALADSVERIGAQSSFGRDYRLHHFLRGLLLQRQNRHAEAIDMFRQAIFSPTDGYTRINLELARSLMHLQRFGEAIAVLQPALRGGVDGSNTYVTHTELHEALAHAFHGAGQRDSATVHYAAVTRAWRNADPQFSERVRVARARASAVN